MSRRDFTKIRVFGFHLFIDRGAKRGQLRVTGVLVFIALTCSVVRSVSSALGSSDEQEEDLRCSWNLLTGIQRTPSSGAHALMSFISTNTALPCLSLMGSKYTCPRSTVPSSACRIIQKQKLYLKIYVTV